MDIQSFIFSIAAIIAVFFSYRQGIKDGSRLVKNESVQSSGITLFGGQKKNTHKESDEERKNRIAFENIENYATSIAQQEVK